MIIAGHMVLFQAKPVPPAENHTCCVTAYWCLSPPMWPLVTFCLEPLNIVAMLSGKSTPAVRCSETSAGSTIILVGTCSCQGSDMSVDAATLVCSKRDKSQTPDFSVICCK